MYYKKLKQYIKNNIFTKYFIIRQLKRSKYLEFSEADIIYLYFLYNSNNGVIIDVGAHYGESFKTMNV